MRITLMTMMIWMTLSHTLVYGAPLPSSVDGFWAMQSLLAPDIKAVDEFARDIEAVKERTPAISFALAIIDCHRYIKKSEQKHADRAHKLLVDIEKQYADDPLYLAYRGMSHSFQARIKTIFGGGDIEAMKKWFSRIDEDHPDWYVRFIRGTAAYNLGVALPDIFATADMKREALNAGRADLFYVLAQFESRGVATFDPATYDRAKAPVPEAIAKEIERLLAQR